MADRQQDDRPERRSFLKWLGGVLGLIAGLLVAVPFAGYLLGALWRKRPTLWVSLGPAARFPLNETRLVRFENPLRQPWDGMTSHASVFVRRLDPDEQQAEQFLVLDVRCAHLGCPVSWFPQSGLFMCPCHGGVYYESGELASGPPPRGMFPCVWRVHDGQLEVQAPHVPTLQDTLDRPAEV